MPISSVQEDLCRIPETIDFPREEEKILEYWENEQAFKNCVNQSKGKPRYTFYDGPPFATGLPHYGHILAGTIKDVVTRYAHQQGYHVERRFGWDCHGLPVEYEIDKTLNIRGPDDVLKIGIPAYNSECRKIVMRYANQWEEIVGRMGRWIDFRNDYKTLYPWYMETIWWVFKQLYEKGLIYQGVKVMPFSTACGTALSNFESGQNYKEIVDPAVFVSLKIVKCPQNSRLLIWTTTPWTLPSNLACCVNPDIVYVKVKMLKSDQIYILAECRLDYVFKNSNEYEITEKFCGKVLEGLKYEPLFPYFKKYGEENKAFRVLVDSYVTEDSGTGIVHQAPYFGEDDFRVCSLAGIIRKGGDIICPVDDSGRFTKEVPDFVGQHIKEADKNIIVMLKNNGNLLRVSQVKHNYPFCWRSDTPLIYKAVPSWFVRVEHMSKSLLACSSQTYWVPEFVKEKRFANWLKEARDWAVSRNRFWGTPIPLWTSLDGAETICIGSIAELEEKAGCKITDLHRESVDYIEIPSKTPGNPPLKRISQVFDCWFESGSMPFAQQHYPFENEKEFTNCFPADFIAEGIDQTRGWFYTLLVISTALFNKPPFKNLIANGLVLASDGQKMSKRKKNFPNPMEVVSKYGADALRLYLINSPVVRAENLRFKEDGVREVIKDVFLPWYNAYRFLIQNIDRLRKEEGHEYMFDINRFLNGIEQAGLMNKWIVSSKESLLEFISKEMKAYRLYTVIPHLTKFIDQLTKWYVRLNRRRIKGEMGMTKCTQSIDTLFNVLISMVKLMAPFTPFFAEYMFQRLCVFDKMVTVGSVHYQAMPVVNRSLIKKDIEIAVSRMQNVTEMGRIIRDRRTLPVKYPLNEIIVIHKEQEYLQDILGLRDFILAELNIRKLTVSNDKDKYGVQLRAEPDHKALGSKYKKDFQAIMAAIKILSEEEIQKCLDGKFLEILGHKIHPSEIRVIYGISQNLGRNYEAHTDNDVLVLLDLTESEELYEEGIAREIINRIQKLKKKAGLVPTDSVVIFYNVPKDSVLQKVAELQQQFIQTTVKSAFLQNDQKPTDLVDLIEESYDIKGLKLKITICHNNKLPPKTPWINIVLDEKIQSRYTNGQKGTILLKSDKNQNLTIDSLKYYIIQLFGLYGLTDLAFYCNNEELLSTDNIVNKTVYVTLRKYWKPKLDYTYHLPFVKFATFPTNKENVTVLLENPSNKLLKASLNCVMQKLCPNITNEQTHE